MLTSPSATPASQPTAACGPCCRTQLSTPPPQSSKSDSYHVPLTPQNPQSALTEAHNPAIRAGQPADDAAGNHSIPQSVTGFRGQLYEKILERVRLRALASAASPLVGLASHAEACASSCASRRSGTNASAALTSTTSCQSSERGTACLVVDSSTPFLHLRKHLHTCKQTGSVGRRAHVGAGDGGAVDGGVYPRVTVGRAQRVVLDVVQRVHRAAHTPRIHLRNHDALT